MQTGKLCVFFIGTAGCGKTSLTHTFGSWLSERLSKEVSYVNLDPGVDKLPYVADYDIRDLFTVRDIMEGEGLGPNGALIRASELIERNASKIVSSVSGVGGEYVLVDTPGQMEIFAFRGSGPSTVDAFRRSFRVSSVFIIDPSLAERAVGVVISLMLATAVQLRLGVPTVKVVNKSDLPSSRFVAEVLGSIGQRSDFLALEEGALKDLALIAYEAVAKLSQASRVVLVSAKTGDGMAELLDLVLESFCVCGDLT